MEALAIISYDDDVEDAEWHDIDHLRKIEKTAEVFFECPLLNIITYSRNYF